MRILFAAVALSLILMLPCIAMSRDLELQFRLNDVERRVTKLQEEVQQEADRNLRGANREMLSLKDQVNGLEREVNDLQLKVIQQKTTVRLMLRVLRDVVSKSPKNAMLIQILEQGMDSKEPEVK